MREIKFRAKGNDEETKNRWFYGGYAKLDKTTYCFKEDYDRDLENTVHYIIFQEMTDWGLPNRHLRASVNSETIGQYTGLHDKNGKEIYEGDIVKVFLSCKSDYIKAQVEYSEEYAQFVIVNTNTIIHEAEALRDYTELEVIRKRIRK